MKKKYNNLMKKCIRLALKGIGKTLPNPMVGAYVLDEDDNIVGYGYHKHCGGNHAEVEAINMAGEKAKNGTLIVNLEPCSHFGKTPPCADLIIKTGLKKVVIGMLDPNPIVAGNGVKKLENAGIEVVKDVLKEKCELLNATFIKNMKEQKVFVAIKTATTLDGKIATSNNSSKWITSPKSRKIVQKIRNSYDAILTSSNTIINDNPHLNCRVKGYKSPVRVVLDSNLRTTKDHNVYIDDNIQVYLFTLNDNIQNLGFNKNVRIVKAPCDETQKHIDLEFVLDFLYKEGIRNVLVEAGGTLNGAFIKENLCDKLYHFIAPKIIGDNKARSCFDGQNVFNINSAKVLSIKETKFINPDFLLIAFFEKIS
ncbi:MAG: bifunctional diaminohydroxyphosphoribosylaminopyrimidine deaminase/5-amino-6-(5-phosphoribosylamino)uracil reductase RibD [Candidatus Gastranaerophilales bacterium]|nr:bifunctional diaminohydroxyphosphoribosylaminopyrimidine deaminase/5-amino-6-(5-phosphoribosylamino)uracil reductase RibD [Candidatus Gastranaerophilales bacterium]